MSRRSAGPGVQTGALVGALLTAPLIAVLFLAWRLFGVPFAPFDLFDWLARVLPGGVVTFGIDRMVDTLVLLGLSLADTSKAAEQILAVTLFFIAGVLVAALLFRLFRTATAVTVGTVLGLALGLLLLLVSLRLDGGNDPTGTVWLILPALAAWGWALGWSFLQLSLPAVNAYRSMGDEEPAVAEKLDRRRFLVRLSGATAVITVFGAGLGTVLRTRSGRRSAAAPAEEATQGAGSTGGSGTGENWSLRNPLPNADASVEPAPGTRPEFTLPDDHYRIDINLVPLTISESEWRLRVDGLVDRPLEFTLEELRGFEPMHQFITLSCISNPLGGDLISTTRWTGVSLQRLLPLFGLDSNATHLRISSRDGFFEVVPIEAILSDERVMLAYDWDGLPLPDENGYPLRIYIPNVYGMKQPKWMNRIEAIDGWEEGYWVERGWDAEARMRATSVIDTIATDDIVAGPDGGSLIPVGGIAHAGARGISRVEVQVDGGEWQEAQLRQPLSELTWVIWRYDWPFEEGEHTFTVRCVDGKGEAQIVERNPVRPSGATGLLNESVSVRTPG